MTQISRRHWRFPSEGIFMVVTGSDLRSNSFKTVFNLVDTVFTLGSVYSAFPDEVQGKTLTFPLAVIENADVDSTKDTWGTAGMINSEVSFPITLYTRSRAVLDIGMDSMAQGIKDNLNSLTASGLQFIGFSDGGQGTDVYGKDRVHFKTLNAEFKFGGG